MRYLFPFIIFISIVLTVLYTGHQNKFSEMPVFTEDGYSKVLRHYLKDGYYQPKPVKHSCVEFYGFYGMREAKDFVLYMRWFDLGAVIQSDPFDVDIRVMLPDRDAEEFNRNSIDFYYNYSLYFPNIIHSKLMKAEKCSDIY